MRLFAAILFPGDVRRTLIGTMHDLKARRVGGNYVSADNLHMTLCFIGEIQNSEPVKEAMKSVPLKPFHLTLTDPGNFGNTLYVGVKGGQKLKEYAKALRGALDAAGISYDRKSFEPHITLVRSASDVKLQGIVIPKTEMMVRKISLMKSEQKNGKTVYTEIFSVRA